MTEGPVVPLKTGNAAGGKGPWFMGAFQSDKTMEIGMSLSTPAVSVRKLQRALYAKAKAQPDYRFYSLWDKVYRSDILAIAYQRCRRNKGSAGIDGQTFDDIESYGVVGWLAELEEKLRTGGYRPQPIRRVWIPKRNGKLRPLGISCIRDRVVQMAMNLVLLPIFESDFCASQYAYRPKLDAKMAVRRVYFHVTERRLTEVVDADLKDYFTTIPHGALMKCVSRRVCDRKVLSLIKQWLEIPVVEKVRHYTVRSRVAVKTHRGIAQGNVISPLMANVYFRRFILAWEKFGLDRRHQAQIVNYADDLVLCCAPENGQAALQSMRTLMSRLGLTVNEEKTTVRRLPHESFDFLGYTIGKQYNRWGKPFVGTRPSKKAIKSLTQRIHDETARRMTWTTPEDRIVCINRIIRGWANYFDQGPVIKSYQTVQRYTERRLRRWLVNKHKQRGRSGVRLYSDEYLYEHLGLHRLPSSKASVLSAKAY